MNIMKNSRLYKFLRKMAGDDVSITPSSVLEDCLDDIADAIEDAGSDVLPAVTEVDNGKILGVVNGGWDKTYAPSGVPEASYSNLFKVLSVTDANEYSWAPAVDVYDMYDTSILTLMQTGLVGFITAAVTSGGFTTYNYSDSGSQYTDFCSAFSQFMYEHISVNNRRPLLIRILNTFYTVSNVEEIASGVILSILIAGEDSGYAYMGLVKIVVLTEIPTITFTYRGFASALPQNS